MSLEILSESPETESITERKVEEPIRVLYIGGQGRSGSTLLGRLLGDVPGFINVGELRMLWVALSENRLCGCGSPIRECSFWSAVIARASDSADGLDPEAILKIKRQMERIRSVPRLLSPFKSREQKRMLARYRQVLSRLYAAIQDVSGAGVIVDGSKTPMYAYYLQGTAGLDLRMLHLVRDSRAVAYSWQRTKLDPTIHWKETHFQPVPPVRVALEWAAKNILMELLTPRRIPSKFLRYEEAVKNPAATVAELTEFVSEAMPAHALDFLSAQTISLSTHHTVTGNPDRFNNTIEIRPDAEWQLKMDPRQRAIVTMLTYPLLAKYGYSKGS
jgi:hypothetical protein